MDAARPGTRIIGLLLGVAWSSWCTAPATPPFPGPTVQPQTRRFEDTSARRPSRRGPTPRIVARRPLRRSLSSRRGAILKAQRQGRRCLLVLFPAARSARLILDPFPAERSRHSRRRIGEGEQGGKGDPSTQEFLPPAAAGGLGFRRFLRALRGARRGGRRANVEARWVGEWKGLAGSPAFRFFCARAGTRTRYLWVVMILRQPILTPLVREWETAR